MRIRIPKLYLKIIFIVFSGYIFLALCDQALQFAKSPGVNPWIFGDWLINYQGGFVRRGFIGEVFFMLSHGFRIDILALVITFQLCAYFIFLINTYRLASGIYFSPLTLALLFSPAFLLFPIYNSEGGFRKEILLFILMSILSVYYLPSKRRNSLLAPYLVAAAFLFIVLSHEMLVIYFPYLICVFLIHEKGFGNQTKRITILLVIAVLSSIFVVLFARGDQQVVIDICNSLGGRAPADCLLYPGPVTGALTFLGAGYDYAHEFVIWSTGANILIVYILTGFLSFVPILFIVSGQSSGLRIDSTIKKWIMGCAGVAWICTIPFLWVAADYGRLINIHIVCMSLLVLMVIQDPGHEDMVVSLDQLASWIAAVLFTLSWRLIYWRAYFEAAFPFLLPIGEAWIYLKRLLRPIKNIIF